MNAKIRNFVRSTTIGRLMLMPYRLKCALCVTLPPVIRSFTWVFTSREHYNFTYELPEQNIRYMTSFVAVVTGQPYATIEKYVREVQEDEQLKSHIIRHTMQAAEKHTADRVVLLGKRIGWYAFIRATKPRITVETGVDKGLGSCVIAAALMKNSQEGFPGKAIGMDLNPKAGYLFQEPYNKFGTILFGDSHALIQGLTEEVDFFIHDSVHTYEFESAEFNLIKPKLSKRALVFTDNAEETPALLDFALATGRKFLFFQETPKNHWFPGGGIGVAFNEKQ